MAEMTFSRCLTLNLKQRSVAIYSCGILRCTCSVETTTVAATVSRVMESLNHHVQIYWRNESIVGAFVQYFNWIDVLIFNECIKKRFQYCIWLEIQRFTWRNANEKQRDGQTSGNRIFGRVLFCISISTRLQYTFLLSLVQTLPFCARHFLQHNWFGFRMSLNIKFVGAYFFLSSS